MVARALKEGLCEDATCGRLMRTRAPHHISATAPGSGRRLVLRKPGRSLGTGALTLVKYRD